MILASDFETEKRNNDFRNTVDFDMSRTSVSWNVYVIFQNMS